MARIRIEDENRDLADTRQMADFLEPYGIWYERWDVAGRVGPDASDEEILRAYQPEIERLKERGQFVTADVINVRPDTPNLDAMLEKFRAEHTHSEDEVRFTIEGRGVFHIHAGDGKVFAIQVESGDLINVPAGTRHWFNLCDDRQIRCIRLFEDPSGWSPHYVDDPIHADYSPVCWGPDYLPPAGDLDPVVKIP